MKQIRVNVRSVANTAKVRREKRNGRDVLIVPSATLPDNVVMNGIRYSADEITKSFSTLNKTPAPYGHPVINGKFVSARDPEGINLGWIGAHNENARRENGRVFLDKVIDVEVANRSEQGKAVLSAIEKGEPVHTSTGLLCELEPVEGEEGIRANARNIFFDHDAILLNEEGAATPEQGVGMLVNAKGEQEEIEVINSALSEADRDLDWAVESAFRALEKRQRAPIVERIKSALIDAFSGVEREPSNNTKENEMTVTTEQFEALSAEVKALSEGIGATVANAVNEAVKPLTDNLATMEANQKAKDEAELSGHIETIVKANLLDEDSAKELTLNAARKLAEKAKPGKAAGINGAPITTNQNESGFKLPKAEA